MQSFNAQHEIEKIRMRRQLSKKKHYHKSRLTRYQAELVHLRNGGASYNEIALWLRLEKRIKVAHTTVMRYLNKLPEVVNNKP